MLFNSYPFLFLFLPLALAGFALANRLAGAEGGVLAIVAASLIFYAAWDIRFLALLLPSIGANFLLARAIAARPGAGGRRLLALGVAANLLILGAFKYAGFAAGIADALLGLHLPALAVLLPLGISFFTFEQIGYLADVRAGLPPERRLSRYAMFVVFFPRLVAGPILRYAEIAPQLPAAGRIRRSAEDAAVGLTQFCLGLAKKTLLADGIAPYADAAFAGAAHSVTGGHPPLDALAAWGGVLAYTLQIYFDFSGYSDMAIGAARLFGLRFPLNFDSPYRATSIIDFWRRWHITLSRFLRDYLYIPLGGNRRGRLRRHANLMATMLLGGLWHGAAWTFVAWGGLHGCYLVVNHGWAALCGRRPALAACMRTPPARLLAWLLTLLAVMLAWVFFRAPDFATATALLRAMAGLNGAEVPVALVDAVPALHPLLARLGIATSLGSGSMFLGTWAWGAALLAIAVLLPNVAVLLRAHAPALTAPLPGPRLFARLQWAPSRRWAAATALAAVAGVLTLMHAGAFLYWQF